MSSVCLKSNPQFPWGTVEVHYNQGIYCFPYFKKSGEVFNNDSKLCVRFKCLVLTALTPLVSLARSIHALSKCVFILLSEVYYYLEGNRFSPWNKMNDAFHDSVRALYFGTQMTGYAVAGLFDPYWARQHYGAEERKLNKHFDRAHRDKFYLARCFQFLSVLPKNSTECPKEIANKLIKRCAYIDNLIVAIKSYSLDKFVKAI